MSRVLHVEDEESLRHQVSQLLASEGLSVESASDGAEAIDVIQRGLFDLVLLDLSMPKVGGMEVLEFVKNHYPMTEVIMVTG